MKTRRWPDFALAGGAFVITLLVLRVCWGVPALLAVLLGLDLIISLVVAFIAGRKGRFRNEVYGWFASFVAPMVALIAVLVVGSRAFEPVSKG